LTCYKRCAVPIGDVEDQGSRAPPPCPPRLPSGGHQRDLPGTAGEVEFRSQRVARWPESEPETLSLQVSGFYGHSRAAQLRRTFPCPSSRRSLDEAEGAALGVAAHDPALTGMDHFAAGQPDAVERRQQVVDGEVRQRKAVARAAPPLVEPERRPSAVGLPALPLGFRPRLQAHPEHAGPEDPRPLRVLRGELHQHYWRVRIARWILGHGPSLSTSRRYSRGVGEVAGGPTRSWGCSYRSGRRRNSVNQKLPSGPTMMS
jgi:hypothetical protein